MDFTNRNEADEVLRKLKCSVQNYDWGKKGESSYVARLYAFNADAPIKSNRPYAELWMGTHDSGPSYIVSGTDPGESLKEWIGKNPNVLGKKALSQWGCDLPFLFKVLSVAKPLSIQAHPDKKLAKILHKLQPQLYKDDNHKPEMALAITEFEALCGFISLEELKQVLRDVPEVTSLIGQSGSEQILNLSEEDDEDQMKSTLKTVFTSFMSAKSEAILEALNTLKNRLQATTKLLSEKEQLIIRLEKQYPGDIGVISAFFFNYVKLNPGEALYLGANEPHAYLSGDCVECMATSDNVVRAGLTPKHIDVQTLCSMLTYKQGFPEILKGFPISSHVMRYLPPFDEFEVDRCELPEGEAVKFPAISGPSIFLVTSGDGEIRMGGSVGFVGEGDVLFVSCGSEISVLATSNLVLYRSGVNSRFLQVV